VSGASPAHELIRLVLAAVEEFAARSIRHAVRRLTYVAACVGLALCCGIGAFGCALAALWIYAVPHVGAVGAPLIVASVLLAIGVGLIMLSRRRPIPRRPQPAMNIDYAAVATELSDMVKEHKAPTLIAAFLAGVMAGTKNR
jgi:uncharacterized membrane protein YfcA